MPIDPSIALGVRPPAEQPNMLGQYAQVMAIRQAQNEMEGNQDVRNYFSRPANERGDISQIMHTRSGVAASKTISENSARDLKTQLDSLGSAKDNVFMAKDPAALADFMRGVYKSDGGKLLSQFVPLERALSTIPTDPAAFRKYQEDFGLTADKIVSNATSISNNAATNRTSVQTTGMNNATSRRSQDLTESRERDRMSFEQNKRSVIPGDNQYNTTDAYGNIYPVSQYGTQQGPNATPAALPPAANQPAASSNLLATQANAQPTAPVNLLGTTPVSQPGAPTVANAAALNIPRPPARAGYEYTPQGQQVKIPQVGLPEGLKLKPGEKWNEEKQVVEQIPGSSAFIEQQKKHGADLSTVKTVQATTKWGTDRIDKILDPENKSGFENNFGGYNAYVTRRLTGNTALVKSELDSLKSDLKNKGLQMMRSGGSIGQMTEKEWPIVESMLATITPELNANDARNTLLAVKQKFVALENLANEKYNDQWSNTQYHKEISGGKAAPSDSSNIDALLNKYK